MTEDFMEALHLDIGNDPVLVAGAANDDQINSIEYYANFPLPNEYVKFLKVYGAAIVGPYSIYGVGASEAMGRDEQSVINVTNKFRRDGWLGVGNFLVISTDHAGNAITLDCRGQVCRFDHDAGVVDIVSPSFGDFILQCLKQSE